MERPGKPGRFNSIPKEGALMWVDMLAIPADAPHPRNAHKLIDYLMRPEVAAANTSYTRYANGNAAAMTLIDQSIRNDPGIYPAPEVQRRLRALIPYSPEFTRAMSRVWTRFTTGR
jgi:putrescine transport system substrate-binding protein